MMRATNRPRTRRPPRPRARVFSSNVVNDYGVSFADAQELPGD
jgi:hypothetical protein